MIDDKINNSLKELERSLSEIESARKQVEKTVNSYDGLKQTTGDYVSKLGVLTSKIEGLVNSIGKDYEEKVKAFEKDRQTILNSTNTVTQKLSDATDEFENSLSEIKAKVKYSLIVNSASLVIIVILVVLLLQR